MPATVAVDPTRCKVGSSSLTRRVLPTPASPTTTASPGVPVATAALAAVTSWPSSASRPSIGVVAPAATRSPGRCRTRTAG